MPLSGWPERCPLEGFNVPMLCSPPMAAEFEKALPPWHEAQFSAKKTAWPFTPAGVSAALGSR